MIGRNNLLGIALALVSMAAFLLACGGPAGDSGPAGDFEAPETSPAALAGETTDADFPSKGPDEPFAVGERGTILLTNDRAYELRVIREDGAPLFVLPVKQTTVIDPSVPFTVRTFEQELPPEMAADYAAVGAYALELHAAQESGYGFALKPLLTIHYRSAEIEAAQETGAALEPLQGNLIVLYKEQRSPKWVPQTSVSVDQDAQTVTVSNIAGAGAWRLVSRKAE